MWGFSLIVVSMIAAAVLMRLYALGLPFDRDGYDEGVYWQSLRAMNSGYGLYADIFYSQPPGFLLSAFPTFALLGGSLWSARLGIALFSLLGLAGACLLGKALAGRAGALAALLLLIVNPRYLLASQRIQAEASSAALELLAIGLALYWWKFHWGRRGIGLAILTGVAAAMSILCKLLAVSLLVPLVMLMVARLSRRTPTDTTAGGVDASEARPYASAIAGIVAFAITGAALLLPFAGAARAFVADVITFHINARGQFSSAGNASLIMTQLKSVLTLTAGYGCLVAGLRRDWRVLPLLAWLLTSILLLWRQVPLFSQHFASLVPPLVAVAAMGFVPPLQARPGLARLRLTGIATALLLLAVVTGLRQDLTYYRSEQTGGVDGSAKLSARVAADLRRAISPQQQVVTDAQFVAALADRSTPPALVDTSVVRILTLDLTLATLESITAAARVHAVLFLPDSDKFDRFSLRPVAAFHGWVARRFHRLHEYGSGNELWVR